MGSAQSSDEEHQFLIECIKKSGVGDVLEIGSASGGSMLPMITAFQDRHFYSVDPYKIYENYVYPVDESVLQVWKQDFQVNVLNAYKNITQFNEKIEDCFKIIPCNLALVFIDGCHDYEYVYKDFWLTYPKVKQGGHIALHDRGDKNRQGGFGSVYQFVEEFINEQYLDNIQTCGSVISGRKK